MNSHHPFWSLCLLFVLSAHAVPPSLRAGEAICWDAASVETIEAPVAIVEAAQAPVDLRDKIAKGLSGTQYLEVAQGKGYPPNVVTGFATYPFTIAKEGVYYLWCRVWWLDECGNSFAIHIDDAKPFIFGEDATFKTWHWVRAPLRLKQLTLAPGAHTITFRIREDGVALNQVLLTPDKAYVPVDVEPVTAGKTP